MGAELVKSLKLTGTLDQGCTVRLRGGTGDLLWESEPSSGPTGAGDLSAVKVLRTWARDPETRIKLVGKCRMKEPAGVGRRIGGMCVCVCSSVCVSV